MEVILLLLIYVVKALLKKGFSDVLSKLILSLLFLYFVVYYCCISDYVVQKCI